MAASRSSTIVISLAIAFSVTRTVNVPVAFGVVAVASFLAVAAIVSHVHIPNTITRQLAVARTVADFVRIHYNGTTCIIAVARAVTDYVPTFTSELAVA
jgi:hypothetical protein